MMQHDPALIIADRRTCRPPTVPTASDPAVTAWRDRRGMVGALSHVINRERWLHILGIASYKLDLAQNMALAVPWENVVQRAIIEEFQSTVWPTFLQIRGWEVLHASAVIGTHGIVAFSATSETGKSTLAYGLSQRGHALWADDTVVLKISPRSVQTRPLPFSVRLRPASALFFGRSENQIKDARVRCEELHWQDTRPLATICLLERAESLPENQLVTIAPVDGADALVRVLERALYFTLQDHRRKRRMVQQYLSLIAQVRVLKLYIRGGLERLPTILDQIEERILG